MANPALTSARRERRAQHRTRKLSQTNSSREASVAASLMQLVIYFAGGEFGEQFLAGLTSLATSLTASFALRGVTNFYRFKDDGTFQLWNADSGKFHSLGAAGTDGAAYLTLGQTGDADVSIPTGYALKEVTGIYRFKENGDLQLYSTDSAKYHTIGAAGAENAAYLTLAQTGEA